MWYVFRLARGEPPRAVDQWLSRRGVRMARFKKRRFDYHENITDVYLFEGPIPGGKD